MPVSAAGLRRSVECRYRLVLPEKNQPVAPNQPGSDYLVAQFFARVFEVTPTAAAEENETDESNQNKS